MNLNLTNKVVLVTGASRGIGLAISEGFLKEGASVVLVSRGSEHLLEACSRLQRDYGEGRVVAFKCNCTDAKSLSVLRDKVITLWSRIDVVVANVGDGRSVPEALPDEMVWRKIWDVNFESALLTSRTFLPHLKESKGSLLFISSIAGIEAFGAPVDYSTAKAAIIALAKNMSRKLANEVRVNVVAPGNVYFSGGEWDNKIKKNADSVKETILKTVPMNRFGTPNEIANSAIFICSERASFITGAVLVVDGGQTVGV